MLRLFWDLKLRHLVDKCQRFGATSCLFLQGKTVTWDQKIDQTIEECRKGLKLMVEPVKTGGHENGCFVRKSIKIMQLYSPEYRVFYFV